jgi:hypothetical protein
MFHGLTLTLDDPNVLDTMAEPSWQEQIRLRLAERNVKQNAFASIIEQCLYSIPLCHLPTHPSRPQTSTADQAAQRTQCVPPQSRRLSPRQSIQLNSIYTRHRVRRRVCHPLTRLPLTYILVRVGTPCAQLTWRPSSPRYLPSATNSPQCTRHKARTPSAFSQ